MSEQALRHLGTDSRDAIDPDEHQLLDTFPAPDATESVRFVSDELTAHCPVTGQPDFYHFVLEYEPKDVCLESKSLKLYLMGFRDVAMYAESMAGLLARRLAERLDPWWLRVELTQQVRGGLQLTAEAYHRHPDMEDAQ